MNCDLYNAISEGNVDVLRQHVDQLEIQTTSRSNTALHVAAQFDQLQCTTEILKMCPSLLRRKNIEGETPLHMAAREGYANIVEALVEGVKEIEQELESSWGGVTKAILRATNVDGDTALHMAMRNCHLKVDKFWENKKYLEVVSLLTREDPEFQHLANNARETPLYLAAKRGDKGVGMVEELLKTCKLPNYGGPARRTALHAAILNDFTGKSTKRLLEWNKDLIKEADINGWTPLQWAAFNGNKEGVKELLKIDKAELFDSITTDIDGQETILHIAVAHGHVNIMQEILSYYPDCWETVNSKGQNVLHIAVAMEEESVIRFIIQQPWLRHLINKKDNNGDTPLHLLIASDCKVDELWKHHRADHQAFNDSNMAPLDLAWSTFSEERMVTFAKKYTVGGSLFNKRFTGQLNIVSNVHENLAKLKRLRKLEKEAKKEEEKEAVEGSLKAYQTLVVVAALIATISFAAAFTIPGGYDGNQGPQQGMAVLSRSAAFNAFLITNTLALVSSVTSLFLCLTAIVYTTVLGSSGEGHAHNRYTMASILIFIALVAMMLAFITASFTMLAHSLQLAQFIFVIAFIPFLVFFHECGKLFSSVTVDDPSEAQTF